MILKPSLQLKDQFLPPPLVPPQQAIKPPKVATPTPFTGSQSDLESFKAKHWLYLSMRHTEFLDECSKVLFMYMKGGITGPWAMLKINEIINAVNSLVPTLQAFGEELEATFANPNKQWLGENWL